MQLVSCGPGLEGFSGMREVTCDKVNGFLYKQQMVPEAPQFDYDSVSRSGGPFME